MGEAGLEPTVVDEDDPIGRPDVAFLEDGTALVSWIARVDDGGVLRIRTYPASGPPSAARDVAAIEGSRRSGFPRLCASGATAWLAWTERCEPPRVRAVRIDAR